MPVSFSQMSTTATPFLYQTRTLSSLPWRISNAVCQPAGRGRCISRALNSSARFQHLVKEATIPTTSAAPRAGSEIGLSIKRTTNMSGVEPPSGGSWEFDPEKSAFRSSKEGQKEFQTRKHFSKSFEPDVIAEPEDLEGHAYTMPEDIEFDEEFDNAVGDLWGKDEIQELTSRHQNRESTITVSERRAFQKIFTDIIEGPHRPSHRKEGLFSNDDLELVAGPENKQKAKSKLDDILTSAIMKESKGSLVNQDSLEAAIERYPPALRPAAARALGFIDNTAGETASIKRQELNEEELEALREPEYTRVEGLMKKAKSDFELWNVMEKEVFSLIAKLGLEDVRSSKVPKNKKRRGKKPGIEGITEETDLSQVSEPIEAGKAVSPLALYGPLYPSYLLLGLRLLDRGFAKPSPLALALLPRIKSFGFTSHVLGASTQFYNELLRIYHYRQDDFRGMIDLLAEMENSALDVDDETLGIVLDVIKAQRSINHGAKGPAVKALWSMPEFAHKKFEFWRDVIHKAIFERTEARH
ncbi:hypothetical protein L207DRAFT_510827 [Hyaloscypha variabilis F]|uniref:Mtf2-like C-terminal domain-containing protein n=1 Tax=Hyaloscypha variabilis (strain UAMH 11265 / GT02V1 / F) TaxID=1149755 RepID=A0A2J6RVR0_HYAVF|nr:hypothetical protein L207DRAFT_510827 [Hyaloscypha variabilis F]